MGCSLPIAVLDYISPYFVLAPLMHASSLPLCLSPHCHRPCFPFTEKTSNLGVCVDPPASCVLCLSPHSVGQRHCLTPSSLKHSPSLRCPPVSLTPSSHQGGPGTPSLLTSLVLSSTLALYLMGCPLLTILVQFRLLPWPPGSDSHGCPDSSKHLILNLRGRPCAVCGVRCLVTARSCP